MGPSRKAVKAITGVKTRDYAYPFGLHGYGFMYDSLKSSRYRTAVICEDKMFHYGVETNLFAMPRLSVYGGNRELKVASVDRASGSVTLTNVGESIPLRVTVIDAASGKEWSSELQNVVDKAVFSLPPEAFKGSFTLLAEDKARIFHYIKERH
jgi:hypothetical protein